MRLIARDCWPSDQLHAAAAARRSRLYLAVEFTSLFIYVEDRTGNRGRVHGRRQAIGSDPDDGVSAVEALH